MGYSYLLESPNALATFRSTFSIPDDVDVAYCHESDIALHRGFGTALFLLMAILEGGVRFPVNPLLTDTLRYYGLCPDQLPPNFYRVVSCVSRLNHTFNLQLNYHDINHMYRLYIPLHIQRQQLRTYSAASLCICGHQNPWVIALCAKDRPPTWPPHTPSCSSVRSSLTFSRCKHKR